jgi:hypothetical protein
MPDETVTPASPGAPPAVSPVEPPSAVPPTSDPVEPAAPGAVTQAEAAPSSEPKTPEAEKLEAEQASEAAKRLNERKKSFRDRIDQMTWEKRELERRALAAESRIADLEKRANARPDPAKYDDPAKYEYDDRAAQAADLRRHEVKLEAEDAARQAAMAQVQVWQARCEEYAADVPDFQTVTDNPRIAISPEMARTIMDMDDGPAVAYHLAKNPATAQHIANMAPRQQATELGKIAGRLAQSPALKRVTQAPPPPATVQGRAGNSASTPDIAKMSMEEYARYRNAQIKAARER